MLLTSTVRPCTSARTYQLPLGSNQANHSLNFRQLRVVQYDLSRASDHRVVSGPSTWQASSGNKHGRTSWPHPRRLGLEKAWMRNIYIGGQNRQSACKVQGRRRRGWYERNAALSVPPFPTFAHRHVVVGPRWWRSPAASAWWRGLLCTAPRCGESGVADRRVPSSVASACKRRKGGTNT